MTVASSRTSAAPPAENRLPVLDVLRGVAILGTLGTNIWLFTDPVGPVGAVLEAGRAGVAETLLRALSNGKFLTVLSVLFGVGLELQYRSARRRGVHWPGWYLWRAALLFGEGVLHYLLVFEWDILMAYAVVSLVVAGLVGRSDRVVRRCLAAAAALHVAVIGLLSSAPTAGSGLSAVPGGADLYRSGGYLDQVAVRIEWVGLYRSETIVIIPMTVALFLLGSRLMRAGMFGTDPRAARLRTRLAVVGLGVGVPLNLLTAFAGSRWLFVDRYLCAPLVALGLLAVVTTVVLRMSPVAGAARRGVGAVGRTALSCYVLQNVLCAVLCYGWGLGLAERLADWRPWWVPVAWAVICVLEAVAAVAWLRRYDRGPLETVWHRAYRLPQRTRISR